MKAFNRITCSIAPRTLFNDLKNMTDATISYNQGDLLVLDGTNHLVKAIASGETGANVLGLAQATVVDGKPKSPTQGTDVDAAQAIPSLPGAVYGVIAKLVLKTGDAINSGALVYPDPAAGTYHVTATAGSLVAIGFYQGPAVASAVAGQEIEVHLAGAPLMV
jgi:hypothetical protein